MAKTKTKLVGSISKASGSVSLKGTDETSAAVKAQMAANAAQAQLKQQQSIANGQTLATATDNPLVVQATKIDPYQSAYNDKISALADKIANREQFQYDFNTDPLYQNYKDQYQRQATLGQESAMANAAALSGGYGNSYAATAGNLAYQENMAHLNDVIPQLYQMAYDKYNTDLANQRADLDMWRNLDSDDYSKYRDTVSDTQWNDQFKSNNYYQATDMANTQKQRGIDNKLNSDTLTETIRHNKAGEKIDTKSLKETIRHNKAGEKIDLKALKKGSAGGSSGGGGGGYYRGSGTNQKSIPQKYYNKIWSAVAKYQGGNGPQGEIANNVLKGLRKKYGLTSSKYDAAFDRIYNGRLGFNDKDQNREYNKKVYNSKGAKYQTREQAMKAGASKKTVTYEQYLSYCQSGNKNYTKYSSYTKYLAAMVKKGKK